MPTDELLGLTPLILARTCAGTPLDFVRSPSPPLTGRLRSTLPPGPRISGCCHPPRSLGVTGGLSPALPREAQVQLPFIATRRRTSRFNSLGPLHCRPRPPSGQGTVEGRRGASRGGALARPQEEPHLQVAASAAVAAGELYVADRALPGPEDLPDHVHGLAPFGPDEVALEDEVRQHLVDVLGDQDLLEQRAGEPGGGRRHRHQ